MTKKICMNEKCLKIIVENWEKWLKDNPFDGYIECPYCGYVEKVERR